VRVGIFGGTFAPIHNGHVNAAHTFLNECKLDKLYVMPAGNPPHKEMPGCFSSEERLEMARLAFSDKNRDNDRIEVSDFEIRREGKSYSYYTLKEFSKTGNELFMLCGTDMFMSFDKWYRFEDLFRMCTLCLVLRNDSDVKGFESIEERKKEYEDKYNAKIVVLKCQPYEVSSTLIRSMITEGKDISRYVPESVCEYIKRFHGNK